VEPKALQVSRELATRSLPWSPMFVVYSVGDHAQLSVLCMSHVGIEACIGNVVRRVHVSGCHTAQHLRMGRGQQPRWERLDCCQRQAGVVTSRYMQV
jgi:hypothetical protein